MPEVKSYCVVNDDEKHFCKFDTSVIFLKLQNQRNGLLVHALYSGLSNILKVRAREPTIKKYYHYYYAVHAKITAFLVIVVLMRGIPIILLPLKL